MEAELTKERARLRRFLSDQDLRDRGITFSKVHRNRLIKAGKFPRPVKMGFGPNARNSWPEAEIDAYQQACADARDKPADTAA